MEKKAEIGSARLAPLTATAVSAVHLKLNTAAAVRPARGKFPKA